MLHLNERRRVYSQMEESSAKMTYTLNSGVKGNISFSKEQIQEWIKVYNEKGRYVTVIGDEIFGLNSELVADFKIHNLSSVHREVIVLSSLQEEPNNDSKYEQLAEAYNEHRGTLNDEDVKKPILLSINCKCGETYIEEIYKFRTKSSCSKCHSMVFLDRKIGMVETEKGNAWYLTNRYFVERNTSY